MDQLQVLLRGIEIQPTAVLDIALTALLIYGLFSLIRGTRAVRLVIGVSVIYGVYLAAQLLGLQLVSQILQAGAVVGLLAIVVVFQPELRRALERIGRVGSLGWLLAPGSRRAVERVASEVARAATTLAARRHGALIILERETGLEDAAETGVMIHADLTAELLMTIFTPSSPLHDGAAIVRDERILAARVVLPLAETSIHRERFGTRHLAALGISEQTDALAVVVSEETAAVGLVERGRILRNLDEERLRTALQSLLPAGGAARGRVTTLLPRERRTGVLPWRVRRADRQPAEAPSERLAPDRAAAAGPPPGALASPTPAPTPASTSVDQR